MDIRAEAVLWLREELRLMNDEGAHWVQGAYVEGTGYCIKGASNAVLCNKAKAKDESKFTELLGDDGLLEETDESLLGSSHVLRTAAHTIDPAIVQVQDAVEIALNMAIVKLGWVNLRPSKFFGTINGEAIITQFNDDTDTDWNNVVKVHELAVELCSSGESPLEWRELGEALAKQ